MKKLNVLVACEESQTVTRAFREKGHNAFSCDIQETSGKNPEWHICDDVTKHLNGWDMIIAFPPCTDLSNAQAGPGMIKKIKEGKSQRALDFIKLIWDSCDKVSIENPVSSYLNNHWIPYTQIIQPYFFGHDYKKQTCLWLKNLPPLISTLYNEPKYRLIKTFSHHHKLPALKIKNNKEASKIRSKFHSGVAEAMVNQWT